MHKFITVAALVAVAVIALFEPTAWYALPFAVGVLTLEDPNLVKQRCRLSARRPGVAELLTAFFSHIIGKNLKDLQFVPFDQTSNADTVIANVACKLYAVVTKKAAGSTVASWLKLSDHATTAAAGGDLGFPIVAGDNNEHVVFCDFDGVSLANGLTLAAHTSLAGSTDSLDADAQTGFCIVGAA